jgi:hypothetical protein
MERTPRLLPSLMTELFQSERSAYRHPIREAKRLGDVPPAIALRAVAAHANEVLDELPELARARGLEVAGVGTMIGETFSNVRHFFADRLVDMERSYRATLLGMRHGIDLVRVLRAAALDEADLDLASFCDRWLAVRERLALGVERELEWFGRHQTFAARHAALLPSLFYARST